LLSCHEIQQSFMNAYEKIGRKLQEAREEAGLSQGELAKKIGCTQASLSHYESGKRRLYLAELQRIGQIMGKPITYFLEDPEDKSPVQEDLKSLLEDPYIMEVLSAVRDLKLAERKSVLDFILWQKSGAK
jgi:transcriptional regulator with XRE-family HTH domain